MVKVSVQQQYPSQLLKLKWRLDKKPTAGNTDTTIRTAKSDDKVIEGEFNKLPEEPDSTEQQDIKSNTPTDVYDTAEGNTPPADVNGSADDILPPPGETNGQSNEEMSEHPGQKMG